MLRTVCRQLLYDQCDGTGIEGRSPPQPVYADSFVWCISCEGPRLLGLSGCKRPQPHVHRKKKNRDPTAAGFRALTAMEGRARLLLSEIVFIAGSRGARAPRVHSSGQFVSLPSVSSMATTKESAALMDAPPSEKPLWLPGRGDAEGFPLCPEQNAGRIHVAGLNISVLCRDACLADGGGLFSARSFVPVRRQNCTPLVC